MNKTVNLLFMLLMAFVAGSRAYHIYQFGADNTSIILLVVSLLLLVRRVLIHKQLSQKTEQTPKIDA